ncbi:MAG: alpha/beta hydrolase family protein [Thermoplasmata archaeon]
MDDAKTREVHFPPARAAGEVRGIVHWPEIPPSAGFVVTHGRSGNMQSPLVRRIASAVSESGVAALRMNFRYADEKAKASRDLRREEDDLRGAIRFLKAEVGTAPIFVAGTSMGARVCARASSDPDVAGMIALGYPLHPLFKPQVRDPPEWPMIAKPVLFVQGDQDPFCDLTRLREELSRLTVTHALVVIPDAGHTFEPKGLKRDTFPEVRDAVLGWLRQSRS